MSVSKRWWATSFQIGRENCYDAEWYLRFCYSVLQVAETFWFSLPCTTDHAPRQVGMRTKRHDSFHDKLPTTSCCHNQCLTTDADTHHNVTYLMCFFPPPSACATLRLFLPAEKICLPCLVKQRQWQQHHSVTT
jgi:hypothetical protein